MKQEKRGGWNRIDVDLDELNKLYLDERLTAEQVAERMGIGVGTIYNRLRELGITRSNSESHLGITPSNFKGRYAEKRSGYIIRAIPKDHRFASMGFNLNSPNYVYIREHRLVMAEHMGRILESSEVVHHLNRKRDDNRIENLELLPSQSHHMCLMLMAKEIEDLRAENDRLSTELAALKAKDA